MDVFPILQASHICGVPIDEALKVLTIYRETGISPSKDYAKGFEDGVNKAYEEINKWLTTEVRSYGSQLFRSAAEGTAVCGNEDDGVSEP